MPLQFIVIFCKLQNYADKNLQLKREIRLARTASLLYARHWSSCSNFPFFSSITILNAPRTRTFVDNNNNYSVCKLNRSNWTCTMKTCGTHESRDGEGEDKKRIVFKFNNFFFLVHNAFIVCGLTMEIIRKKNGIIFVFFEKLPNYSTLSWMPEMFRSIRNFAELK